jgi:hypothetical protein
MEGNLSYCRLDGLGGVLFHQLGHDRRELRAYAAPICDAIMLQVN